MMREGRYPNGLQPPFVPGSEFAGVVLANGAGSGHLVGARVFGMLGRMGACSEVIAVPAHWIYPTPDHLSDAQAAGAMGAYLTAAVALYTFGGLARGQRVLVNAAGGGVGTAACQLARAAGATQVIGTAGAASKVARLVEFGVDTPISYLETEDLAHRILAQTGGRGVDVAIDSVGGDVLSATIDCVAPGGRLVSVGAASGRGSSRVRLDTLLTKGIAISGFTLGKLWRDHQDLLVQPMARVLDVLNDEKAAPVIAAILPVERAAEAHAMMSERAIVGRVVLSFED